MLAAAFIREALQIRHRICGRLYLNILGNGFPKFGVLVGTANRVKCSAKNHGQDHAYNQQRPEYVAGLPDGQADGTGAKTKTPSASTAAQMDKTSVRWRPRCNVDAHHTQDRQERKPDQVSTKPRREPSVRSFAFSFLCFLVHSKQLLSDPGGDIAFSNQLADLRLEGVAQRILRGSYALDQTIQS